VILAHRLAGASVHIVRRRKRRPPPPTAQVELVRTGRYREARVEGWAALVVRRLVGARAQTVGISIDLSGQVRGTLEAFASARSATPSRARSPPCRSSSDGR
jgi:transposase